MQIVRPESERTPLNETAPTLAQRCRWGILWTGPGRARPTPSMRGATSASGNPKTIPNRRSGSESARGGPGMQEDALPSRPGGMTHNSQNGVHKPTVRVPAKTALRAAGLRAVAAWQRSHRYVRWSSLRQE